MFQRMMAIPQEEYLQLTAVQQARQPLMRQFQQLENQYQQHSHITDPYRKLVHQAETLDDLKALKEKMRNEVVLATPKPYQSRARSLFQHLEPILKFNERGEIFDEQNQLIPESRIEDLIQYAVRDRRRHFLPTGWGTFIKVLRTHNVPKYVLNRNTLDEMENISQNIVIKSEVKPRAERWRDMAMKTLMKTEDGKKRKLQQKAKSPKEKKIKQSPTRQRPLRSRKRPSKYGTNFLSTY